MKIRGSPKKKPAPGQQRLPWANWQQPDAAVTAVAKQFVGANALNPDIALAQFADDDSS